MKIKLSLCNNGARNNKQGDFMKIKELVKIDNVIDTPWKVMDLFSKDLLHTDIDEYLQENLISVEINGKTLLVKDKDNNYLCLFLSYCKHESCFCSKITPSQIHHENFRKFQEKLWNKFMDRDYQQNEFKLLNDESDIHI